MHSHKWQSVKIYRLPKPNWFARYIKHVELEYSDNLNKDVKQQNL